MSTASSTYLNYCSYKSIEDQFIDDCLQTDIKSKQDFIQTELKIISEACISINEFTSEKFIGRWTIEESLVYLDVLKSYSHTRNIIKGLMERLPQRIESQIRAHHQKMMKKYGSREQIINCLDREQNYHMMEINKKLSVLDSKLSKLTGSKLDNFPKQSFVF